MAKAKAKRLSEEHAGRAEPQAAKPVFDSPFKQLKRLYAGAQDHQAKDHQAKDRQAKDRRARERHAQDDRHASAAPKPAAPSASRAAAAVPKPVPVAPSDEKQLFQDAFRDVRPLSGPRHAPPASEPGRTREIVSEDAEVLAELSDLVTGQGEFDITETEEYVEGARAGLDPRLIVRLRRGEFPVEAHLDLHGMTQPDCRRALSSFILEAVRKGQRTVLVVPGRGLGSPGGRPVLKHAAVHCLSHGMLSAYVLGFVTARPTDGGAGALYVLLRRDRRRAAAFDVLNGAKRHD